MKIISVSGTQCSGKTYVITPFLDHPDVAFWDILDLYEREKCIVDNKMDWDRWNNTVKMIIPELKKFLEQNKDKKICIIESGTNQTVTGFLSTIDTVDIQLKTPNKDVIVDRAGKRKLISEKVLDFREMFLVRHAHNDIHQYTQEEATLIIKAYLTLDIQEAIDYKSRLDKRKQLGK